MFGVLEVVLRADDIASLDFGLGQRHVTLIASLRILRAPLIVARAILFPAFWAGTIRRVRSGLA